MNHMRMVVFGGFLLSICPGAAVHAAATQDVLSVYVSNVEELYSAVNNSANAGAVVVLAPGAYTLSAADPAASPRPHGGRLELQRDMSLAGVAGDPSAVVIDGSLLPTSSFAAPSVGRTGVIRTGRGSNAIDSITIRGSALATAGIETDLTNLAETRIRVANVISGGSQRGLDVRNTGALMAGRRIDVEITESDFSANPAADGITEGVRIANLAGATGGHISAVMSGNRFHDAKAGCLVANQGASGGTLDVRSDGDTYDANGVGCLIAGGLIAGTSGAANGNATTFEARGSRFVDNAAPPFVDPGGNTAAGGIIAIAAEAPLIANAASDNEVVVRLWGSTVSGNAGPQLQSFGARSTPASGGLAGTNDHATLELHGVSKFLDVLGADSVPVDPGATNTVTVIR